MFKNIYVIVVYLMNEFLYCVQLEKPTIQVPITDQTLKLIELGIEEFVVYRSDHNAVALF